MSDDKACNTEEVHEDRSDLSLASLLEDSVSEKRPLHTYTFFGHSSWIHWFTHILFLITIYVVAIGRTSPSRTECWSQFNSYTPMKDFIARYPYIKQPINGSMLYHSEFVGEPNNETENAWRSITSFGLLQLTTDEIVQVGYPEWSARFPTSAVPEGGYPAVVVGSHALHCLHYIYQDHHLDSPHYTSRLDFKHKHPERYEKHFGHCIDYVRQRLMCNYDMSVTPYFWVKGSQAPMPGAITHEICVDWENMRQWMRVKSPVTPDGFVWQVPDGAVELESPP